MTMVVLKISPPHSNLSLIPFHEARKCQVSNMSSYLSPARDNPEQETSEKAPFKYPKLIGPVMGAAKEEEGTNYTEPSGTDISLLASVRWKLLGTSSTVLDLLSSDCLPLRTTSRLMTEHDFSHST